MDVRITAICLVRRMYRALVDRLAQIGYNVANVGYRVYPDADTNTQVCQLLYPGVVLDSDWLYSRALCRKSDASVPLAIGVSRAPSIHHRKDIHPSVWQHCGFSSLWFPIFELQ